MDVFSDPFEREQLKHCRPSPLLAVHFAALAREGRRKKILNPEAGFHNLPHFRMMKEVILDARRHVRSGSAVRRVAVILGAKECNDIPLDRMADDGEVYLIDVDGESLGAARETVRDPACRSRIHSVVLDASLYESELLKRVQNLLDLHREDIGSGFRSIVDMQRSAAETGRGVFDAKRLPVREGSADLVISSMTLSQFVIGYLQGVLKIFQGVYGRVETREYLLFGCSSPGRNREEPDRVAELLASTLPLVRSSTEGHVRELARIVKDEGVVVLSDHGLHGRCAFATESEVDVLLDSLVPYSKNPAEEKSLQFREDPERSLPSVLRVEIAKPCETYRLRGSDALGNVLSRLGALGVLDERQWWWVTEKAKGSHEGRPAWHISYVESFIFQRKGSTVEAGREALP